MGIFLEKGGNGTGRASWGAETQAGTALIGTRKGGGGHLNIIEGVRGKSRVFWGGINCLKKGGGRGDATGGEALA